MFTKRNAGAVAIFTTGFILAGLFWKRRKQKKKKTISLKNINPPSDPDYYFHLYLDTEKDDIESMFSGVRYLLLTAKKEDATQACEYFQEKIYGKKEAPKPISKDDRFRLHLCGPLLIASTGIGGSSISILLQEITKLLSRAGASIQGYICIDRSFSSSLPHNSVVICGEALAEDLKSTTNVCVLGETKEREIIFSTKLAEEMYASSLKMQDDDEKSKIQMGKAMGAQSVVKTMGLSPLVPASKQEQETFQKELQRNNILVINEISHVLGAFCGFLMIDCALVSIIEKTFNKQKSAIESEPAELGVALDILYLYLRDKDSL